MISGWKLCWLGIFALMPGLIWAEAADLCSGASAMLNIVNRPTMADSPCTVPDHKIFVEQGYLNLKLLDFGQAHLLPTAQLRFGLPKNSELFIWLPSYTKQTIQPTSGFSDISFGIKRILTYTDNWLLTLEGYIAPPSGSKTFGTKGEGLLNGIFSFSITQKLSVTCELGISTQTDPPLYGAQRYSSVNPDVVVAYLLRENIQVYGEAYGQSKTASNAGSGYNVDAGIEFLLRKNMTIDIEAGQRLRGTLGGLENYFGAGLVLQLN